MYFYKLGLCCRCRRSVQSRWGIKTFMMAASWIISSWNKCELPYIHRSLFQHRNYLLNLHAYTVNQGMFFLINLMLTMLWNTNTPRCQWYIECSHVDIAGITCSQVDTVTIHWVAEPYHIYFWWYCYKFNCGWWHWNDIVIDGEQTCDNVSDISRMHVQNERSVKSCSHLNTYQHWSVDIACCARIYL